MTRVTLAATTVVTALLSGCGPARQSGDDLLRVLRNEARNVDELTESRWVPPDLPSAPLPASDDVAREARSIAQSADDLPSPERWEVINATCDYVDAMAVEDGKDAATYVIERTGTSAANASKINSLADNLSKAKSSFDATRILGQAAVCEAAGARS